MRCCISFFNLRHQGCAGLQSRSSAAILRGHCLLDCLHSAHRTCVAALLQPLIYACGMIDVIAAHNTARIGIFPFLEADATSVSGAES